MSDHAQPEPIPFITDDQLARRLAALRDELIHIGYRIPALAREAGELHRLIAPRDLAPAPPPAAAEPERLPLST